MLRAAFKVKFSVLFQRHSLLELRRALELPFYNVLLKKCYNFPHGVAGLVSTLNKVYVKMGGKQCVTKAKL